MKRFNDDACNHTELLQSVKHLSHIHLDEAAKMKHFTNIEETMEKDNRKKARNEKIKMPIILCVALLVLSVSSYLALLNEELHLPQWGTGGTPNDSYYLPATTSNANTDATLPFHIALDESYNLNVASSEWEIYRGTELVGHIATLDAHEFKKGIVTQDMGIYESQTITDFKYDTYYKLEHYKMDNIIQINHYFFDVDPDNEGKMYRVSFFTPHITDEQAYKYASTFRVNDDWYVRSEYVKGDDVLFTVYPDPALTAGKAYGYMFNFTEPFETFEQKEMSIYATNRETGKRINVLPPKLITEPSPGYAGLHRFTTTFEIPFGGMWRFDVYLDEKFYGDIVLDIRDN